MGYDVDKGGGGGGGDADAKHTPHAAANAAAGYNEDAANYRPPHHHHHPVTISTGDDDDAVEDDDDDEQQQQQHRPWWCFPLLAAAVLAVSTAGAVFKELPDVPPLTLAAWRLQLTSVLLAGGAAWQFYCLPSADRARCLRDAGWIAASGVCLAIHFATWVGSLKLTSLAHSLLLVSCAPLILVVAALVRRAPISRGEVGFTALALAGACVLAAGAARSATGTGGGSSDASSGADATATATAAAAAQQQQHQSNDAAGLSGDLLAFSAAVAVVGYLEIGAKLRAHMPALVYAAPVTALAAAILTAAALTIEARGALVGADRRGAFGWLFSRKYAPPVLWLGVVPGIVGHTGFNTLLRHISSLTISLAIQLEPPAGALIGWLLGVAAPPSLVTCAGGAVVLLATCGVLRAGAARAAAEEVGRARRQRSVVALDDSERRGGWQGVPVDDPDAAGSGSGGSHRHGHTDASQPQQQQHPQSVELSYAGRGS